MRKFFAFLFLLSLTTTSIQAQKKSPGKKTLNWGLKTGLNVSTLQMNQAGADNSQWKTGYVLGAFFKIKASSNFSIQPEFLYSSMGGKTTSPLSGDFTYRLNYFSIPILANIQLSKKWHAVLGPQFDFLINAKNIQTSSEAEVTNTYQDNSINATAGFEFWPCHKVGVCARYMYGLTDISKNNSSIKNQGAQLTVALKL